MLWLAVNGSDLSLSQHGSIWFAYWTQGMHEFTVLEAAIVAFVVPPEEHLHLSQLWFEN